MNRIAGVLFAGSLAFTASLPVLASDATAARARYDAELQGRLVPLIQEVVRFPTVKGNADAFQKQKDWLKRVGTELGFTVRDKGLVTEIELPGPEGAPVIGLVVHGDVQPADEGAWSQPPFEGRIADGMLYGRGAADDKGPLVQALLAMKALKDAGPPLTHTVRLLVGSDEESDNVDIKTYLASSKAPDLSLVLDAVFPAVVGEKAWNALTVTTANGLRGTSALLFDIVKLEAGTGPSIVPDRAVVTLKWRSGTPDWNPFVERLRAKRRGAIGLMSVPTGDTLEVTTLGTSAHSGMNIEGGRNALVGLAELLEGELPASGFADLLAFAKKAGGPDVFGTGLGLTQKDNLWGRYLVNVATITTPEPGKVALTTNIRRPPPLTGPELRAQMEKQVADFNAKTGASLVATGFYDDEPYKVNPKSKLVKRLLAAYKRGTGEAAKEAVIGGGTYAKRLPHAIAFGMWFPKTPYPGHEADEKIEVGDLHKGVHVLLEALCDLASNAPTPNPLD